MPAGNPGGQLGPERTGVGRGGHGREGFGALGRRWQDLCAQKLLSGKVPDLVGRPTFPPATGTDPGPRASPKPYLRTPWGPHNQLEPPDCPDSAPVTSSYPGTVLETHHTRNRPKVPETVLKPPQRLT